MAMMARVITEINNGIATAPKGMPFKDSTSDGDSSFAIGRRTYVETQTKKPTESQKIEKKWYGNRDASQIVANRRIDQVGVGSLNTNGGDMSFKTTRDVNVTHRALSQARSGGAIVPPKVTRNTMRMFF
jgi:hypothetical protein